MPKPNFLGIGTQRSASTFLHTALAGHPEIVMPREGTDAWNKEQHFFNKGILSTDFASYEARFRDPDKPQATRFGEITPGYCILPPGVIRNIRAYLDTPRPRIILLVRNPVYRIFSNFKLHKRSKGFSEEATRRTPLWDAVRHAERPGYVYRTDYPAIIGNWSRAFGRENVKVVTFDELTGDPLPALRDLARFLEVDPGWFTPETVDARQVYVSPEIDLPPRFRAYLAWRWLPMVEELDGMLEGRVAAWRDELAEEIQRTSGAARLEFRALKALAGAWNRKQVRRLERRFRRLEAAFPDGG